MYRWRFLSIFPALAGVFLSMLPALATYLHFVSILPTLICSSYPYLHFLPFLSMLPTLAGVFLSILPIFFIRTSYHSWHLLRLTSYPVRSHHIGLNTVGSSSWRLDSFPGVTWLHRRLKPSLLDLLFPRPGAPPTRFTWHIRSYLELLLNFCYVGQCFRGLRLC